MTLEKGTRELHTGPDPTSTVPCPLRDHHHIAMGRCVEYQRDNGCHCEHALVALRRTERFLADPKGLQSAYDTTAHADQLDGVRALIERAEAMERNRPAASESKPKTERFERIVERINAKYPPARPQPFLRPAPPAAPPSPPAPACEIDGCDAALRVNNLSGVCQRHRQQVPSRKRAGLVPDIARATGTAGDLIQQIAPAVPAKESEMAQQTCTCGKKIRTGRDGVLHDKCLACRRAAGEAGDGHRPAKVKPAKSAPPPPKAKPPPRKAPARRRMNGTRVMRQLAIVAAKHLTPPARHAPHSAPPADIVHLLEDKLAHHQEQAAKCERALQALR